MNTEVHERDIGKEGGGRVVIAARLEEGCIESG